MASFNSLPNEVLLLIAESLPTFRQDFHFSVLALTCRRLYQLINPVLYGRNRDHNNSIAVLWAAEHGRIETLEKALFFNLDLDTKSLHNGYPALYIAVIEEQVETVDWLLNHGVSPNSGPDDDDDNPDVSPTPLYCTLRNNQLAIARLLIAKGACLTFDPLYLFDSDELYGELEEHHLKSAIHVASFYGSMSIVRDMVRHNIMDINAPDGAGLICLHYAIMGQQDCTVVDELIRLGANVNLDCDHCPLLCLAIEKGYFKIADVLLNAGLRINGFSPPFNLGPIHLCIGATDQFSNKPINPIERYSMLEKLIDLGADPNRFDVADQESTPLGEACHIGDVEAMSILLRRGAEVDLDVGGGRAPLSFLLQPLPPHITDKHNKKERLKKMISLLMRYSARLDVRWHNSSPLEDEVVRSIKSGDFEILDFMLSLATEQNLSTKRLDDLLKLAHIHDSIRCVKLLLEYGAKSLDFPGRMDVWVHKTLHERYNKSILFYGRSYQDTDFENLLNMWMDFNPSLDDKSAYFWMALKYRDRKAVDFLLSRGIAGRDEEYYDPIEWLQEAACWGHLGVLRRLLQYSPDINGFDDEDYLPLSRAVQAGHREAVILLMEHGADAYKSKATGDGQDIRATLKPIQHAIRRGDVGILTAILDKHKAPLSRKEAWVPSVLSSAPDIAEILALHPSISDPEDI